MANEIVAQIKVCSVCSGKHFARGFCYKHYNANRKNFTKSLYTGHLSIAERLELLSEKITESGCQIWTYGVNKAGYGRLGVDNKVFLAHRLSYELAYGEIPKGMLVCHKCDTPACINPTHLFLGTNNDNMQDKVKKGRQLRGEKSPVSILTDEQVIAIRLDKRKQSDIAKDYGVSKSQIGLIHRNEQWTHLTLNDSNLKNGRIDNGHMLKGDEQQTSKLNESKVKTIRLRLKSQRKLAVEFGVSRTTINLIQNQKAWKHVL